jgi:LacI family transcriptional regulator
MTKPTRIDDVAKRAGVSVTTVSRVISNSSHSVNRETAERIQEAIRELDFTPSRIARAMKNDRAGIVGALVSDNTDPYFATIVHGVHSVAQQYGAITIICNTLRDPQTLLNYIHILDQYNADGIVLAGSEMIDPDQVEKMHAAIESYRSRGGRVIALSETTLNLPRISVDNYRASHDMTSYLLSLGHRRIGFVRGPARVRSTLLCEHGFVDTISSASGNLDPSYLVDGDFTFESGLRAVEHFLSLPEPPTAIFAPNDITALGCVAGATQRGLHIPDDLSIAGMNDIQAALYSCPQLTTINFPMNEMGMQAVHAIYRTDDNAPASAVSTLLPHRLVVRGTTQPPRI